MRGNRGRRGDPFSESLHLVHRAHYKPGPVSDYSHVAAVETNIGQASIMRLALQGIGVLRFLELFEFRVTEQPVIVEIHLRVDSQDFSVGRENQRIYLYQ